MKGPFGIDKTFKQFFARGFKSHRFQILKEVQAFFSTRGLVVEGTELIIRLNKTSLVQIQPGAVYSR